MLRVLCWWVFSLLLLLNGSFCMTQTVSCVYVVVLLKLVGTVHGCSACENVPNFLSCLYPWKKLSIFLPFCHVVGKTKLSTNKRVLLCQVAVLLFREDPCAFRRQNFSRRLPCSYFPFFCGNWLVWLYGVARHTAYWYWLEWSVRSFVDWLNG